MRAAAEWVADKEGYTGDQVPSWVNIGYSIADPGLLVLLVSTVLAGLSVRRSSRAEGPSGDRLGEVSAVLVSLLLIAYLVTIWAMTTKPV